MRCSDELIFCQAGAGCHIDIHNVPRALGGGWQYKQHLLLQIDPRSPQYLHLELQNVRQRVQAGRMRCRGAKQAPTLRRAPSAGGSGAPPRLRRAMPRPGRHRSARPQELWKQPHLLSLHISPPRNMSRLYHRAPKLAMACCGCPCAHRPLIHPPCLAAGTPELSTRPRTTTSRCMCASARAKAPHAARAQHAAAPRPGRRAACKQPAVPPGAARKPQCAPLFAWRHGLHALTARPRPQTTARPPLKHTKGGEGAGPGDPRASRAPQTPLAPRPGPWTGWTSAPAPAPPHADSYLVCVLDLHVAAAAAGLARLVRILVLPPHQLLLRRLIRCPRCQQTRLHSAYSMLQWRAGPRACARRTCFRKTDNLHIWAWTWEGGQLTKCPSHQIYRYTASIVGGSHVQRDQMPAAVYQAGGPRCPSDLPTAFAPAPPECCKHASQPC